MLYKIDPRKLAKSPQSLVPILFACFEYDSSSPYFEAIRPYLAPSTADEKWEEIIFNLNFRFNHFEYALQMQYEKLMTKIERKYQVQSRNSNQNFNRIKASLLAAA
jgi:hypothetical protein